MCKWPVLCRAWLPCLQGYNQTSSFEAGLATVRWMTDYLLESFKTDPKQGTADAPEFLILYQVGRDMGVLSVCAHTPGDSCCPLLWPLYSLSLRMLQSGNYTAERGIWNRPESLMAPRPSYYISTYDGEPACSSDHSCTWAGLHHMLRPGVKY